MARVFSSVLGCLLAPMISGQLLAAPPGSNLEPALVLQEAATPRPATLPLPEGAIVRLAPWGVHQRFDGPLEMAAAFSGDILVIGGGKGGDLFTWDTILRKPGKTIPGKQKRISFLTASADGRTLVSFAGGPGAAIWKATGAGDFRLEKTIQDSFRVALSPTGQFLASYNGDVREIDLWDLTSGKVIHHLRLPDVNHPMISALAFSPDGNTLAAGYNRGVTRPIGILFLWDVKSGRKIAELGDWGAETEGVLFSPDGRTLAASRQFIGAIEFWELVSRQVRHRIDKEGFLDSWGAFSPDGTILALGGAPLRLREVTTGKLLCECKDGWFGFSQPRFSSNGKLLATSGGNGSVLLWDLERLRPRPPAQKVTLTPQDLQDLWTDLASKDAAVAYRAIIRLSHDPARSVPFLAQCLRPLPAIAEAVTAPLIRELDSNTFAERQHAVETLERLGEAARTALRKAAKAPPSAEVKQQVTRLLEKIDCFPPPADCLRALRAVEVLERIGTLEARRVIEALAIGALDAPLTRDARAALERLAHRRWGT